MAIYNASEQLVIDGSPVEFALVGPYRRTRSVFARSTGETLDLVGLDGASIDEIYNKYSGESGLISKFLLDPFEILSLPIPESNISRAVAERFIDTDEGRDVRYSEMSFCWRGHANRSQRDYIEQMFSERAGILYDAARRGRVQEFQWHIAPIIAVCERFNEQKKRRLIARRNMLALFLGLYVIAAAIALTGMLTNRLFSA